MKKFIVSLLTLCLLIGTLSTAVLAETEPTDPLASNLVVHYDFNGDTLEAQLSDKATGGVSLENLTLVSSKNADQTDASYVKDGVLHIDKTIDNYAYVDFNETVGKDIFDTTSEMTLFMEFEILTVNNNFIDILDVHNVARTYVAHANSNTPPSSPVTFRVTSDAYNANTHVWNAANNRLYHAIDHVVWALTLKYDATTKKLDMTANFSYDNGKTFTESTKSFEDIEQFFSNSTGLSLGKLKTMNTDRNGTVDIYDVRIYNKVLTANEIKAVAASLDTNQKTDDTTDNTTTDNTDNTTAPTENNTTAPAEQNTTAAPATTEAPAEEKKGCGSVVATGITGVFVLTAGAYLSLRKKKD